MKERTCAAAVVPSVCPRDHPNVCNLWRDLVGHVNDDRSLGEDPERLVEGFYRWIAQNVTYNVEEYLHQRHTVSHRIKECDGISDTLNENEHESRTAEDHQTKGAVCPYAEQAVLKMKATCVGLSELMCALCWLSDIPCVQVMGHVKGDGYIPGDSFDPDRPNHVWNAVFVGGAWRLLDVTWAGGHVGSDASTTYTKRFTWHYCLTDPRDFVKDHRPLETKWQLLDQPLTLETFEQRPKYDLAFMEHHFETNETTIAHGDVSSSTVSFTLRCSKKAKSQSQRWDDVWGLLRHRESGLSVADAEILADDDSSSPPPEQDSRRVRVYIPFLGSFLVELYLREGEKTNRNLLSVCVNASAGTTRASSLCGVSSSSDFLGLPPPPRCCILHREITPASSIQSVHLSSKQNGTSAAPVTFRVHAHCSTPLNNNKTTKLYKVYFYQIENLKVNPASLDYALTTSKSGFHIDLKNISSGTYKLVVYEKDSPITKYNRWCTIIAHLASCDP